MSTFTETKVIDQITVTENGTVFYREATQVFKDNEEVAKTYHRSSLLPGQDITGVPANVAAICNVAWTTEIVSAYQASLAEKTLSQ
jgi:DNA-binding transcriptional LysR family regulator